MILKSSSKKIAFLCNFAKTLNDCHFTSSLSLLINGNPSNFQQSFHFSKASVKIRNLFLFIKSFYFGLGGRRKVNIDTF